MGQIWSEITVWLPTVTIRSIGGYVLLLAIFILVIVTEGETNLYSEMKQFFLSLQFAPSSYAT